MILYIQIILISVLGFILVALYLDEKQKQKASVPTGRLTQFWDGIERRRFVRIDANVPVKYSFPKEVKKMKTTKTKNMSVGGISISLNEKLSLNAQLSLEIECPNSSNPIIATGTVTWVEEDVKEENETGIRCFNIGVEFKDILPQDRERLLNFIKDSA